MDTVKKLVKVASICVFFLSSYCRFEVNHGRRAKEGEQKAEGGNSNLIFLAYTDNII